MLVAQANNRVELLDCLNALEIKVGGRIGSNRRTTKQCELWVLRKVIRAYSDLQINYPIELIHQDSPDFFINSCEDSFGIEITETAPAVDGKGRAYGEAKVIEESRDYYSFSEVDGRHSESPELDAKYVREDIQKSITEKASKEYVKLRPTELWIYPNSFASFWLNGVSSDGKDWERISSVFDARFTDSDKFKQIVVYFSDDNIWVSSKSDFKKV